MTFISPVKQTDARTIIAKFREIVDANPDVFAVQHERQRATKNNAEDNRYMLLHKGTPVVTLYTNKGRAVWVKNLREVMRGKA